MKATIALLAAFFLLKASVFMGMFEHTKAINSIENVLLISLGASFAGFARKYIARGKAEADHGAYIKKLNSTIIEQSQNNLFYEGNTDKGAQALVRQVTEAIDTDRCSIWLYSDERDSITCEQLYVREEGRYYRKMSLSKKDFAKYFEYLEQEPIIAADKAESHPATKCFREAYLIPNGIKSMLDVPIIYKGIAIGVICIESLSERSWNKAEIDFAQMLSSLYSFAYSVKESNTLLREIKEFEEFVNRSVLVSRADKSGKITYVNEKFSEVSGWTLEEALGKDHSIVNSGLQREGYWGEMYKSVLGGKIWNDVVTNKAKNGEFYHVDTYIKANFDEAGNLEGFVSIRQDVTEMAKLNEQLKGLVSSQTAYVLRTDMEGKHTYWNEKFEDEFGWVYEGNMMHGDSLLSICESHHGAAHNAVMQCVESPGKIVKVELDKPHRDGSRRTTLWEFVCLTDRNGNPFEVQCMGIDITDRVNAEKKISDTLIELGRKETDFRYRMNAINQSNMVIEFDPSGDIKFANKNFCDLMGYSQEELIGKHHRILIPKNSMKPSEYAKFWKKLNSGDFISSEFKRIKKSGEEVWLHATYNPILDGEGKVISVMKIATDVTERIVQSLEIDKKNTYLEHAAKIIRHDMHSGINTYIPRGVKSLERRLTFDQIKELKIEAPIKMIKEGLSHTQKVYKGVYEFTNLVKSDSAIQREPHDLKQILSDFLRSTSYFSQVAIDELVVADVNDALFCTAIDNLIRNGLKYNDSDFKMVAIFMEGEDTLAIQDNGRGMTQEDFDHLSKPYVRRPEQKETGTGLGLNICTAILKEHGFSITCEKNETGTKLKIKIK